VTATTPDGAQILFQPNAGPQTRFLSLTCLEALYGGAAGGGKSCALVIDAIRYVGRGYGANYQALLLRRTFPELEASLILESHKFYPALGGKWNDTKRVWTFPAGERVQFGHCEGEKDVHRYQGAEFQFIAFDELTSFTLYQYTYLFSRLRSAKGVRCRMRAATNPGNEGHEWVLARFAPWLDRSPNYEGARAAPGEILYFARGADDLEHIVERNTPNASGRTFVPASIVDNPAIASTDYASRLDLLDPVTRARLRDGDWLIKPGKGAYFKRGWFQYIDIAPATPRRVRYWDRAATEPKKGKSDPDWTVGLRFGRSAAGLYFVDDIVRFRGSPHVVEATIKATAIADGARTTVWIEEDPGAAGKFEASYYVRALSGFRVKTNRPTKDKITRAGPVSSQVEHGNVAIVGRGAWVEPFITELESFPEGAQDDQVDALSGAFTAIATPPPARGVLTLAAWRSV
jgi:predicted phage terminase large subunit-like protein